MPSLADFENPDTGPLVEKYLGGKAGIPTGDRSLRLCRATAIARRGALAGLIAA
ncbi:MAG: 4-hydroxyphenylacetate 3-hydroxylase C-terminal domain-containing protein [Dehalococcoidia bacterium]